MSVIDREPDGVQFFNLDDAEIMCGTCRETIANVQDYLDTTGESLIPASPFDLNDELRDLLLSIVALRHEQFNIDLRLGVLLAEFRAGLKSI